ncbi:P-loop ATPase, Sll1717 family [Nocardioides cynanchi]|uniref:P-loop ATPase, Sll1717 family n=1 Tax=Nocardioides cynanchi TaxID=2558918 RepID=UPI0012475801|nr:hypothetical protein [Nocardioides cynanchi]
MNQRQLLQLMESVKLGSDVAEHESELSDLFVTDNEAFLRLTRDEVDIIAGGKGAGKSAIFRMITETQIQPDLHVIRASNPTAGPEFRALFQGDDSEERLRSIWAVYVTSTIANYAVDCFSDSTVTASIAQEISDILTLMGLRTAEPQAESLLSRIRKAKSVQGGLKGGVAGLELGVALKFELPEANDDRPKSVTLSYPDFFSLLQRCGDLFKLERHRVWLAFDRLDECFVHDSSIERRALRALLRTHLDASEALHHSGWIRLKIFLRSDMLTRMTADGAFTNATHLRMAEIAWTFNSMRDLIARRLIRNQKFVDAFLSDLPLAEWTEAAWAAFLPQAAPPRTSTRPARGRPALPEPTATRLTRDTSDGTRLFNPRNLITLVSMSLDRARQNLRRDIQLDRANRHVSPLVRENEVGSAFGELSRRRLQDTVLNEFPAVQQYSDRLRGGSATYATAQELLDRLGIKSPDEGATAIDQLTLSGLLGSNNGGFVIPRLYRFALSTKKAPPK